MQEEEKLYPGRRLYIFKRNNALRSLIEESELTETVHPDWQFKYNTPWWLCIMPFRYRIQIPTEWVLYYGPTLTNPRRFYNGEVVNVASHYQIPLCEEWLTKNVPYYPKIKGGTVNPETALGPKHWEELCFKRKADRDAFIAEFYGKGYHRMVNFYPYFWKEGSVYRKNTKAVSIMDYLLIT